MDKKIFIDSYNPYEFWFPGRKFVGRDTLRLIKYLKRDGYDVIVKPDNNKPFEYLFQKGIREVFSDPIYIQLFTIGSAVIANLVTNAIQKVIDKAKNRNSLAEKNIIINIQNNYYNIKEEKLLEGEVIDKKKKEKALQRAFKECFNNKSPFLFLPVPILLEHQPRIVGWCSLQDTSEALMIKDSRIIDKNVFRKIEKGKIKGASMTGIANKTLCSICNQDYIQCLHVTGEFYNEKECANQILEATPLELSFVKEPVNEHCIVEVFKKRY